MLAAATLLCAAAFAQAQTVSTIYNFADNGISGANPWYVTLVQGTNGNLYGTTYNGGANLQGTVFNVTTSGQLKNCSTVSAPPPPTAPIPPADSLSALTATSMALPCRVATKAWALFSRSRPPAL